MAETTAGGLICAALVAIPGSSAWFDRGFVAYSKAAKVDTLSLDEQVLEEHGAVSEQTAGAMAEAVRRISGATWGLAETGIAGPVRGRSPKPPGTACLAIAGPSGTVTKTVLLQGDRLAIREGIRDAAVQMAVEVL